MQPVPAKSHTFHCSRHSVHKQGNSGPLPCYVTSSKSLSWVCFHTCAMKGLGLSDPPPPTRPAPTARGRGSGPRLEEGVCGIRHFKAVWP